jgi:hypothetical protein
MQVNRPYGFGQGLTLGDSQTVDIVTPTEQNPSRGYHLSWGLFNYSLEEGQMIKPGVYELTSLQESEVGDSVYSFGLEIRSDQMKLYSFATYRNATLPAQIDDNDELDCDIYLTQQVTGENIIQHLNASAINVGTQQQINLVKEVVPGSTSDDQSHIQWHDQQEQWTASIVARTWSNINSGTVEGDNTPADMFTVVAENWAGANIILNFTWD